MLAGAAASALATQLSKPGRAGAANAMPAEAVPVGAPLGAPRPFSFEILQERAKQLATTEWHAVPTPSPEILERIDYDAYQEIRYRRDMSLMLDQQKRLPVQMFHLGSYTRDAVHINVVSGGQAREVLYSTNLFDIPADHPARQLPDNVGFAGFRIMAPDLETDWLAFMGASYFRTSGPFNQYGLSARGLAIDTGLSTPEEFPRFTEFWLETGSADDAPLVLYALLDGPSVTGAYRMTAKRTSAENRVHHVDMVITQELFARKTITRLGIAPFSSMYWYGETSRRQVADWRPEIHDSDGLAIWTGAGERLWRPINNPPRVMTNTFVDNDIRGFGLLQRDRDFVHYLDDSVFYERRPSVWVEPIEPFGKGALHLLEIPTDDEIHDNIATYWCPDETFTAGSQRRYSYRLSWMDDVPFPPALGQATATWTGLGGRPGHKRPEGVRKFVIDFQGQVFDGVRRDDGVEIVVTPSRGTISNAYTHPVVDQRERWRALFDLTATGSEPVDIRAYLRKGDRALTETWVYQFFPEA
jgi:glucans biosynthesis protein